jgi:alpha-tubulin suppressor-like RCC1 family protein
VSTNGQAYCWGNNVYGQLGDGTTDIRMTPVAVLGGLRFRQVDAGGYAHSCGVTTDYRAYCWGWNSEGQLGDRTRTNRLTPVPVRGGLMFRQVSAGSSHTCALTYPDRSAYCWGSNNNGANGALGDGTTTTRLVPVAVLGGRQFRQVSAGHYHSCGVTLSYNAFCWGANFYGQLGDDTRTSRLQPVLVFGGHQFQQLDVGGYHSCAVTTAARAFCWGYSASGQVGVGTTYPRRRPFPVAGGLYFSRVTAGEYHTCGETTGNRAYCWGGNAGGGLGDGSGADRLTPVPVSGGLFFSQVSAGGFHTCARTPAAVAYCWGENASGQLGDGTRSNRYTPTPVAGPM